MAREIWSTFPNQPLDGRVPEPPYSLDPGGIGTRPIQAGVTINQGPVAARIDQPAIIMLAMQLHQQWRRFAQQSGTNRLIVDEALACPIQPQLALENQRLARLDLNFGPIQHGADGRGQWREFKSGGDAGAVFSGADQTAIGSGAQHQTQRVEQDRLAAPVLARKNAEAASKIEISASINTMLRMERLVSMFARSVPSRTPTPATSVFGSVFGGNVTREHANLPAPGQVNGADTALPI